MWQLIQSSLKHVFAAFQSQRAASSVDRAFGLVAVIAAIVLVYIDWVTWVTLDIPIIYTIPLVLAGMGRNRRLLWILLPSLLCATFIIYARQIGHGDFALSEPYFVNRLLSSATMLLTAGLLDRWTRVLDNLDERDVALKNQNTQLAVANTQLSAYQEQIKKQNEDLDRQRREAVDTSKRKTILLASISHDIQTPIAAIGLAAQAVRRAADDPAFAARLPELVQQVQANAAAVSNMVSDVLDFATLELGHNELHTSELALDEIIYEECRRLLPLAQAKNLTLEAAPMSRGILLHTDRVKLSRVLRNLVVNSVKYTAAGFVRVGASRTANGGVCINVEDSGIGIAPEDIERIFGEFTKVSHSDNQRSAESHGLGLSICRRLAAFLGAKIEVKSDRGRGSVFTVTLPPSCVIEPLEPMDTAVECRPPSLQPQIQPQNGRSFHA